MRRNFWIGMAIWGVMLGLLGCSSRQDGVLVGGIQINEPDLDKWAKTLKKSGMNTVEVTVYGRNGDWDSQWMRFEEEEPFVLEEIRAAKKQGLKVVLVLRQALDHYYPANKFLWHGMIFPKTEPDLKIWFESYANFVQKWAITASEEEVDALVIGSELNALAATLPTDTLPGTVDWFGDSATHRHWEERVLKYRDRLKKQHLWARGFPNYEEPKAYIRDKVEAHYQWANVAGFGLDSASLPKINARRALLDQHWREVIRMARTHFSGELSFAANFDNYREVGFWDELDFIGINAYFPLREAIHPDSVPDTSEENFQRSWKKIFGEIEAFRSREGLQEKPVFFTELGYAYRENSTLRPWQADGFSVVGEREKERLIVWPEQAVDRAERLRAVNALREAVNETGFPLSGILYWKLTAVPELVEIEPFALQIAEKPVDSLQVALSRFRDLPVWQERLTDQEE